MNNLVWIVIILLIIVLFSGCIDQPPPNIPLSEALNRGCVQLITKGCDQDLSIIIVNLDGTSLSLREICQELEMNDDECKGKCGCPTITNQTCIDSDAQCKGKPDGTSCTYGVWCDEYGRVCGGQSCVGLGLGECYSEKCIMK